jgi:uncharacterized protein (DUF58 family)
MRTQRRALRVFRIASLLFPSAVAWEVATLALHTTRIHEAVARVLGALWIATTGALFVRTTDRFARRRKLADPRSWLDVAEVLTAAGSSMAWTGAMAVLAATALGWPSLSVVGLFGLCVLQIAAFWTLARTGGDDPWNRASLTRRFPAGRVYEGDAMTEEVHLVEPRVPAGFRLFASGRVGPRWPISRYVVSSVASRGEIVLESEIGPARRGTHEAEPLEVWLQDVLGLCHSPRVRAGEGARLTVLPRPARIEGARVLLQAEGHGDEVRPPRGAPTSGSLALREYAPGDDCRRIHWLRSLTAGELIVRLPDERPPQRRAVRLILDTFHPHLAQPTPSVGLASADLLDALVHVWLGVGRSLVDQGERVTAVVTASSGSEARTLARRSLAQAQELGARAEWQRVVPPAEASAAARAERSVVVSYRLPIDDAEGAALWVVVPSELCTAQPAMVPPAGLVHKYPLGSADNRGARIVQAQRERLEERTLYETFRMLTAHSQARRAGHILARPAGPGLARLEVLS